MADLRLWSREVISDFIELYKSHLCLWNVKCEGYKNKYTKSLAYKDLVQFCKIRGFPEANRDFVSRKLQSLRGSFRKETSIIKLLREFRTLQHLWSQKDGLEPAMETAVKVFSDAGSLESFGKTFNWFTLRLRKLEKCKKSGEAYETNLWYFNNLMFTTENNPDGDDHVDQQSDEDDQSEDAYNDDDISEDEEEKFVVEDKLRTKVLSPQPPSPQPKKRKIPSENCPQPEFFDVGQEPTRSKELSEFELTGMNIAKKLARMDETQAIYAESLINNVIRKGLLKKLKEDTDLCDNLCGRKLAGLNLPSQSI